MSAVAGSVLGPGSTSELRMPRRAALEWLRDRGMGASILVAALSSAFGAVLLIATGYLSAVLRADPTVGESHTLGLILDMLAVLLAGLAVYVGSIVTANTFSTVIAGRTRRIALLRLIGASARSQRTEVARQGLIVGLIGAAAGLIAGVVIGMIGIPIAQSALAIPPVSYSVLQPVLLVPAAVVALTTWAAAWVGSRPVLTVTPLQALGGSVEASRDALTHRAGRNAVVITLLATGVGLLVLGILAGLITPFGLVIAFGGGILSFTGLSLGATLVMPPVLRLVGSWFGSSAPARLAAENALRYPERSSRMAIGVVMGVTLVTMFAVAIETMRSVLAGSGGGALPAEIATTLDTVTAVMMSLVGVSAVIAGVGLVNLLTLGIVQRRREFGLLRALGLSTGQVRAVVLLEAAHITIAALVAGLVLGTVYGWAGAQAMLGSVHPHLRGQDAATTGASLVVPGLPLWPLVAVVVATAVLALVAAVVPTRLATRVAPVEALAE